MYKKQQKCERLHSTVSLCFCAKDRSIDRSCQQDQIIRFGGKTDPHLPWPEKLASEADSIERSLGHANTSAAQGRAPPGPRQAERARSERGASAEICRTVGVFFIIFQDEQTSRCPEKLGRVPPTTTWPLADPFSDRNGFSYAFARRE